MRFRRWPAISSQCGGDLALLNIQFFPACNSQATGEQGWAPQPKLGQVPREEGRSGHSQGCGTQGLGYMLQTLPAFSFLEVLKTEGQG